MFNICCLSNAMQCMDASRTAYSVENVISASLFTRWRHSQYNSINLKPKRPDSSIYIFKRLTLL